MPFRHLHLLSSQQPTQQPAPAPPVVCPYLSGGCPLFTPPEQAGGSNLQGGSSNSNENYYGSNSYGAPQQAASPSCNGGCGGSLAGTSSCHPSTHTNSANTGPSSIYKAPMSNAPGPSSPPLQSFPSPTYPLPLSLSPPATLPQVAELDSSLWTGPYVDFGFGAQEPQSSSYYSPPAAPPPPPPQRQQPMPSLKRAASAFVDIEDLIAQQQRNSPQPLQPETKRSRPNSVESDYSGGGFSPESIEWAKDAPEEDGPATPFISKLVYILNHPQQFGNLVTWDSTGSSIVLAHAKAETLDLFSKFFRHSTVASFVRQLNIYAFKRLSTMDLLSALDRTFEGTNFNASDYSAFSNPNFWRATPARGNCSLASLKPIAKDRASRAKKAGAAPGASASSRGKKAVQG